MFRVKSNVRLMLLLTLPILIMSTFVSATRDNGVDISLSKTIVQPGDYVDVYLLSYSGCHNVQVEVSQGITIVRTDNVMTSTPSFVKTFLCENESASVRIEIINDEYPKYIKVWVDDNMTVYRLILDGSTIPLYKKDASFIDLIKDYWMVIVLVGGIFVLGVDYTNDD